MAIITVHSAEVVSVYPNKGFRAKSTRIDSSGQERTTYVKVWSGDRYRLNVGDLVNISGELSTRVEEGQNADGSPKLDREGNQVRYAAIHINDPEVEAVTDAPF